MKPYQVLMANAIKEAQKEPKGFDDLMAEIFEMFMQMERDMFLETSADKNKGNGYYGRFIPSFHGKLAVRVPRTRLGNFSPLMLEVARKQSDTCSDLALQLYAKGLSTRSIWGGSSLSIVLATLFLQVLRLDDWSLLYEDQEEMS